MAQQQVAPILDSWEQWEGRVVAARFALGRYVGGSARGAIYETDCGGVRAAVKMIAAASDDARAQLARWESARHFLHPNLMRVFDAGLWHANEDQDMFFAVLEFGEENLPEVLADRALSPEEARGMLVPILEVFDYLHSNNMLYGPLKPSHIFAVGNLVKLSSDGVRHVSDRWRSVVRDAYAAPESVSEGLSWHTDIWSLGMTLLEALSTQSPWPAENVEPEPRIPVDLPEPFASMIAGCLRREPGKRLSLAELRTMLERPNEFKKITQATAAQAEAPKDEQEDAPGGASVPGAGGDFSRPPVLPAVVPQNPAASISAALSSTWEVPPSRRDAGAQEAVPKTREERATAIEPETFSELQHPGRSAKPGNLRVRVWAGVILAIVAALGLFALVHRSSPNTPATTAVVAPAQTGTPETAGVTQSRPSAGVSSRGSVAHQVMPEVSRPARNSIHGTVRVSALVDVNTNGKVTDAKLQSHGPSRYFAKQTLEAARRWSFTTPVLNGRAAASRWALRFEFKRTGDRASAQMLEPRF